MLQINIMLFHNFSRPIWSRFWLWGWIQNWQSGWVISWDRKQAKEKTWVLDTFGNHEPRKRYKKEGYLEVIWDSSFPFLLLQLTFWPPYLLQSGMVSNTWWVEKIPWTDELSKTSYWNSAMDCEKSKSPNLLYISGVQEVRFMIY